ncbi:MAG: YbjN domain-containing protein [Acidimicrobiia bacterium]
MSKILEQRIRLWLDDPDSSVEYAEELEGRWAVRMLQDARDATTVWFEPGERSLRFEAYVVPAPSEPAEVHRQALVRNNKTWRVFFAVDSEGAIVLRGRLANDRVTLIELDLVLGEIFDLVEVAFRPMIRSGFPGREKSG